MRLCTGRCRAGAAVCIPCACPPDRAAFLAELAAAAQAGSFVGTPVALSNDVADASAPTSKRRATAALSVLQSFSGTKGVGCPGPSAPDFLRQQQTGVVAQGR